MKRYLLDTTPLTGYLKGNVRATALIEPWILEREVATSILVCGEVTEHLKSLTDGRTYQEQLRELLVEIEPYVLTLSILERYADLRRRLRPPNGPGLIGDIDTLIAATALEHNLTLVTTDTDYQRVPHLKLELLPRKM